MTWNMTASQNTPSALSDGDEVRAFQGGDPEAFERLVDRYQRPILSLGKRMLGPDDARDLFQDVFLQVHRSLVGLREPDAFRTWLFRIAVRLASRQVKRQPPVPVALVDLEAPERPDTVVSDEQSRSLHQALRNLPSRQREVLLLRHFEGLSHAEVAEVLGIREDAVRASHYQGLRKLRQLLLP